jgi:DNA-binding FadR family transcriptional regulator
VRTARARRGIPPPSFVTSSIQHQQRTTSLAYEKEKPMDLDHPAVPTMRVPKTSQLVADDLRRLIVNGELAEGATLPPETALMKSYGISRPTLREAMRVLETEDLLTVRRGSRGGVLIQAPREDPLARRLADLLTYRHIHPTAISDARTTIEAASAASIVRQRHPVDLDVLRAAVAAADAARDDGPRFTAASRAMRASLVDLADNPVLAVLWRLLAPTRDQDGAVRVPTNPAGIERDLTAMSTMIDLIAAGDPASADFWLNQHKLEAI